MDSKTGAIRLGFYLHTALAALYHTDASVRESNLRELTSDVDHELRHHRDAEMVAVRSKVLRAILSSEKWSSFYESTAYLSADYLFDLRIEGFAQCDGSCLTLIGRVSDRINLLIQSNPSFFLQQSEMAKAGIQMLGTMAYIDRDSWWQYKARHGFSEYLQSLAIIKVVELSELLRQRGDPPARATDLAENSGYRQQSLYKDYRDSYFSLLDQIANLSSLSEFCDFYLDRAEDLRLKQDELILTPEVVERMKSLDSYFDRSSDAK
ncbi:MAG: hypothetical protein J5J00_02090 [Deltaproteobacteria bacterium]|nr:hypothetical protein [Deltaproteobacteria bacterium]